MDYKNEQPTKRNITCPLIWAIITSTLLVISLTIDYQHELIREHTRFRKHFPSRSSWENVPDGNLNTYLFNVTNSEAFLNGTDKKLKLKQVGPMVYRIKAIPANISVSEDGSEMTFRKVRYHRVTFDEANSPPGILDEKIYLPNLVLLSYAAKIHDWFFLVRNAFNLYALNEPIFVQHTVQEFLWNYTTPMIDHVRQYVPGVVDNVGMLHNAIREKVEIFTVNIGEKYGLENFFKIRNLNNYTVFAEQFSRGTTDPETCPIHVVNSFDNTLFPPYLTKDIRLSIVAGESCRTLPLHYDSDVAALGFTGWKYTVPRDSPKSCLNNSLGIPLPAGIFDGAKCSFDVPTAHSQPHFFGTDYNFSEHFEGLTPNAADHQTHLFIEPTTGIPFEEKIRYQTAVPMPHLSGFSENIRRLNGMIIPTFWYEYDLDELATVSGFLLKVTAYYSPYIQKFCIVMFFVAAVYNIMQVICRFYGVSLREGLRLSKGGIRHNTSEIPNRGGYYDESNSFLTKKSMKV